MNIDTHGTRRDSLFESRNKASSKLDGTIYALGLHFKRLQNFTAVSPIIPRLSKQLLSNRELMNCKCLPSVGWQQAATDSFC